MAPPEKPSREEVLTWMALYDKGAKATATHFDLNLNTVKGWVRWAKRTGWKAPTAPPPPPDALPDHTPQGGADVVVFPGGKSRNTPPSTPPTTPPRRTAQGRTLLSARSLDEEAAELLQEAAHRLLLYMAGRPMPELEAIGGLTPESIAQLAEAGIPEHTLKGLLAVSTWDPKKVKESSLALAIIVDKCPDILSLPKKTAEKDTDDQPAGPTADAVAKAMGIQN